MGRTRMLGLLGLASALILAGCWGAAKRPYDESRFQRPLEDRVVEGGVELNAEGMRVLMFTKTAGFRHGSIPTSKEVMTALSESHGFELDISEDASRFTAGVLGSYDVVMFASTTGEVLDTEQQRALEGFIAAGGGFVGLHAASDTLYDWPWYGELVGAYFDGHPLGTSVATLHNEDPGHPSAQHLEETFQLRDEWYFFDRNPRGDVHVLLTLDEGSNALLTAYTLVRGETATTPLPGATLMRAVARGTRGWGTAAQCGATCAFTRCCSGERSGQRAEREDAARVTTLPDPRTPPNCNPAAAQVSECHHRTTRRDRITRRF